METSPPIMQTPAAPQVAGRGAPAKYKWDDFYCALAVMTHADGIPETQTDLILDGRQPEGMTLPGLLVEGGPEGWGEPK